MKIVVLTGSPHERGTTAYLADKFCEGAEESGHETHRFDVGKMNVKPCLGCDYCLKNDGECVYSDDMIKIQPYLLESDAVVFVTPLYYFGITAQLKSVIDRFYAVNEKLRNKSKKACLITAGSNSDKWAVEGIFAHFKTICRYLKWEKYGEIFIPGAATREDVENTIYAEEVKNLGRDID